MQGYFDYLDRLQREEDERLANDPTARRALEDLQAKYEASVGRSS